MSWIEDVEYKGKHFSVGSLGREYSLIFSPNEIIEAGEIFSEIGAWFVGKGQEYCLVCDFRHCDYEHQFFSVEQRMAIYHSEYADDNDRYFCFHETQNTPRPKAKRTAIPGFVYVIHRKDGEYKIGKSKEPLKRIEILGVKLPFEIEPICLIGTPDMHALEAELHNRFDEKRVNGEWFALTDEDVQYIKGLQNVETLA